MLAIGRALMANPSLILMDEPSEGLSPKLVQRVEEIMRGLRDSGQRSCWWSRISRSRCRSRTASMSFPRAGSCLTERRMN